MNRPQAYVAGAYSAPTDLAILDNVAEALRAGLILARLGYAPIVPHASGDHERSWEQAMVGCRETIGALDPAKDLLVLLPRWPHSKGAVEEVALANRLGIRVLPLDEVIR